MKAARQPISIVFCIAAAVLLSGALCLYLFQEPREISASGSEELALFPPISAATFLNGSFQQNFETAMKDQFALRDDAAMLTKSSIAGLGSCYHYAANMLRGYPGDQGLLPYGDVYRMNGTDWLTNLPYTKDQDTINAYQRKAEEINGFALRHPEAHIYVYYCTRAEDMDWFDENEGIQSYNYRELLSSLLDSNIRFGSLNFWDFDEYCSLMYKTDHHWNNQGADKGYSDLLLMLGQDFTVGAANSILYTQDFGGLLWTGSRARESAINIAPGSMDQFKVNKYLLPDHRTWFGENQQEIGLAEQYAQGQVERSIGFDQYLNYYGFESQPIRLEYEGDSPTHTNLLIVGDSFSRAIREPLAAHFGTTVYVNFRILSDVDLDQLMAQYNIGAVIFMGQQDAWSGYFLTNEDDGTGTQ